MITVGTLCSQVIVRNVLYEDCLTVAKNCYYIKSFTWLYILPTSVVLTQKNNHVQTQQSLAAMRDGESFSGLETLKLRQIPLWLDLVVSESVFWETTLRRFSYSPMSNSKEGERGQAWDLSVRAVHLWQDVWSIPARQFCTRSFVPLPFSWPPLAYLATCSLCSHGLWSAWRLDISVSSVHGTQRADSLTCF